MFGVYPGNVAYISLFAALWTRYGAITVSWALTRDRCKLLTSTLLPLPALALSPTRPTHSLTLTRELTVPVHHIMSGASWSDEEEGGGGSGDEVRHIRRALQRSGARQRERALALRLRDEDQGGEQQQEGGQGQAGQSFALLKKQHSESVVKLEKRCMALEDELNYTKKVLKSKDKHLQEESALVELKVQAIDAEYKQSYGALKKNMFKNGKTIKSEVSKMFYLLSMLEQNTLHGRHLTLSETNVGLLLKLRSSLDDINKACSPLDSKSNDVDDDVSD